MLGPTRDYMMRGARMPVYDVSRWTYRDTSSNGTEAAVLKFVFNFYARVRWSEIQSHRHFCWHMCPGWLIGYRICEIVFLFPYQLHLILQLLCSLTPTCCTNWLLKLSLLVQLGYHMECNESGNVNLLVAGHMKRKWPHRFLTKCAEKVQSWFGQHPLWLVNWEQSLQSKLSDAKTPMCVTETVMTQNFLIVFSVKIRNM